MPNPNQTIFISYRRDVGWKIARLVFMYLSHEYDVFMDVERLDAGQFDEIIRKQIAARAYFLLVLEVGSLAKCENPKDWIRQEVEEAIQLNRIIIPLLVDNFEFNNESHFLPESMAALPLYNGIKITNEGFNGAMQRLGQFLQNTYGETIPIATLSPTEEKEVQRKLEKTIEKVHSELPPSIPRKPTEPLQASKSLLRRIYEMVFPYDAAVDYFNKGLELLDKNNFAGAISEFNEAIRLRPTFAKAHYHRGLARSFLRKLPEAMQDYNNAIELKMTDLRLPYYDRGVAFFENQEFHNALTDLSQAIDLDSAYADAYYKRGEVHFEMRNYHKAVVDFDRAFFLDDTATWAKAGSAVTHYMLGHKDWAQFVWGELLKADYNYKSGRWLRKDLKWKVPMVEIAEKIIAELSER